MPRVDDGVSETAARETSIREMLRAASEIDVVLERRVDRTMGAIQVVRALLLGSIFVFYQLVAWNPQPFVSVFGNFLWWVWVVPVLAVRVVDMTLTARTERMARALGRELGLRQWWLPPILAACAAGILEIIQRPEFIGGAVLVAFGGVQLLQGELGHGSRTRFGRFWRLNAALGVLVGLALLLLRPGWAYLVIAISFVAGGLTLGTLRYRGIR